MTDRELLEFAAKAAGRCAHSETHLERWEDGNDAGTDSYCTACGKSPDYWNPLTDDGDALRLAVNRQMSLALGPIRVQACTIEGALRGAFFQEDIIYQDPNAATRRAIVRAAAEIGKELK